MAVGEVPRHVVPVNLPECRVHVPVSHSPAGVVGPTPRPDLGQGAWSRAVASAWPLPAIHCPKLLPSGRVSLTSTTGTHALVGLESDGRCCGSRRRGRDRRVGEALPGRPVLFARLGLAHGLGQHPRAGAGRYHRRRPRTRAR